MRTFLANIDFAAVRENVQTIWHIFTECPLTSAIFSICHGVQNLSDLFLEEKTYEHLLLLTKNSENSNVK